MTFHVGQKVVCVDAKPIHYPATNLVEGRIYTVRRMTRDGEALFLEEVIGFGLVGDFYARRFRPAVTRSTETGMAILRGLLDTSPVSEPSHG